MYYKRITSDGMDISWLKELETRIANLESPPAGSITIRDTLVTIDPATGVQTQFGTLPDGSRGFEPFIYDITPPPVATAPVAKSEPGVFIITWDGLFANGENAPRDFECCNIIGHKIVNNATVSSTPVGLTRRPLDITFVQTDVAANNEEWEFSLEAEDYNGNRAAWSARSNRVTMQPIASAVDLSGIQADINAAAQAASDAQTAAAQATSDAQAASNAALAASNLAASKGKVLFQDTAPTGTDANAQTLWIDTTNNTFTPKRWVSGTTWTVATDKTATDAAQTASDAYSLAQSKGKVLFQTTAPTGPDANAQTLWIDTTNGANTPKRWVSGTTWTTATDKVATDAAAAATAASNLAASKGKTIIQSSAPAAADQLVQNLWIDTTGGANTPKRWDTASSTWIAITDKAAIDAASAAATAQSKADTAFNNAATAATAAGTAQTTADSKNRVWYQNTPPAGTGHKQNDIWFDTGNDNRINQWNATSLQWVQSLIGNNAILANLDAGKITAGFIAAARLAAKSITVDKLVITSTDNLVVEADFGNNGSSWAPLTATTKTINPTGGRGNMPSFRVTATSILQTLTNQSNKITVGSEDRFRGSFYVRSSVALAAGGAKLRANCYTDATTSTPITIASSPVLVANTYTLVEGISPVLPANTLYIEFFLEVLNPSTATITDIDYVGVTRAADGKLVVDGAIDGKTITGPYIQTDNSVDAIGTGRGVKLNPLGLRAYNAVGQKTFDLNASTGDMSATGIFNSGTAPGTDADVGQTIRVSMGVLTFQNWQNVPGLTFQKFDSGTGAQTPSGFIFYYFQGFIMRSTVPSTVWAANKNESYHWIAQDGIQMMASNQGKADYGTAYARYTRAVTQVYARPSGVQGLNQNDADFRSMVTAVVEGDDVNNNHMAGVFGYAGPGYSSPTGYSYLMHGSWENTNKLYYATAQVQVSKNRIFIATAATATPGAPNQSRIETANVAWAGSSGIGNFLGLYADSIRLWGGVGAAGSTTQQLNDGKPSVHVNPDGVAMYGPARISGMPIAERASVYSQGHASFVYGPKNMDTGVQPYVFVTQDTIGLTGPLQINGEVGIKHKRAEFTTLNWFVAGGQSWDTGPVTIDSDPWRTRNNDCIAAGDVAGAVKFTVAGYYTIQVIYIPRGNPGSGWLKLNHSAGIMIGMDSIMEGKKHEAVITTAPTYFAAGQSVRTQLSVSLDHYGDARWVVVRSELNL